jgi:topoisomerase-4 subunit A
MTKPEEKAEKIREEYLKDALSTRYLSYAMSTIVARSLPDVRDGLKPVHRRLIYAMNELKLNPASGFKKCARVVGDVIGKYHPHGDASVYDAMVRLAQDFSVRYPLVEGQGNFGNIDGDGAAAMRYTEAKMTPVAMLMMQGLDENAVDLMPTYDGSENEPMVMPAAFPNLLANGSSGIAVGMATNIPPHNVSELCDAILLLLKTPEASVADLVEYVKCPDFPTGGLIIENKANVLNAYETGRGSFRVRARWHKEDLAYGNYQIVITEIPYSVQKSRLIEKIAELLEQKKLPLIEDIRDESAEEIRIIIDPKTRTLEPEQVMALLFSCTELEVKFAMNMNVIDALATPRVMSLKGVLEAYIEHRLEVLRRTTTHRLEKIAARLEILAGYLVVYLNIDKVIKIIKDNDEPKPVLMKKFELTDNQAEAILNMKLRSLRKLEEMAIEKENAELTKEQKSLQNLMNSPAKQKQKIGSEVESIRKTFSENTNLGKRRTEYIDAEVSVYETPAETIEKEPITVVLSEKGWLKSLKGHAEMTADFNFKEGDKELFIFHAYTTSKIVLAASSGKFFTIAGSSLPNGRGSGENINLLFELEGADIISCFAVDNEEGNLLIASKFAQGFIVPKSGVLAQTKNGKNIFNLGKGDSLKFCLNINDEDSVATYSTGGKLLVFDIAEIPVMQKGKGVILQRYTDTSKLAELKVFKAEQGLKFKTAKGEACEDCAPLKGKRAGSGGAPPLGFIKFS